MKPMERITFGKSLSCAMLGILSRDLGGGKGENEDEDGRWKMEDGAERHSCAIFHPPSTIFVFAEPAQPRPRGAGWLCSTNIGWGGVVKSRQPRSTPRIS